MASPVDTPSENIPHQLPLAGPASSRSVSLPIGLATPLSSPRNRMIVFGAMGALSLLSLDRHPRHL